MHKLKFHIYVSSMENGILHQPEQVTKAGHVGNVTAIFGHVVQDTPVSMVTKPVAMATGTVTMATKAWMVTMGETKMADPPVAMGTGEGGGRI